MKKFTTKKLDQLLLAILVIVVVGWLAALFFFIGDIQLFSKQGLLRPQRQSRNIFNRPYSPLVGILSAANIQSWMTFNYLEKVFHLPPNYLREELKIRDQLYPRLSIKKFAKRNKLATSDVVKHVIDAILRFASSTPTTVIIPTTTTTPQYDLYIK